VNTVDSTSRSGSLVVAVDGTSGSGKSSTSRGVAERLGLRYLDTGAMFRAMTWWLLREGIDVRDEAAVAAAAGRPTIVSGTDPLAPTITVDGTDVSVAIRTDDVNAAVSPVSAVPEVRARLLDLQRTVIGAGGIVVEGRDIGSVVWPQAEVKVYLSADPDARAQRRTAEQGGTDVASTQPPVPDPDAMTAVDDALPVGAVYALAAFRVGASFVSFTPSPCLRLPVVVEAARRSGLPWAGCDGKTGETLLKSALAPMFVMRALELRSWTSVNLLGGGDGATLADPEAARSKTVAKRSGLDAMVGRAVPGPMHIDQVEDLGEWKTAWDHVRFDGFLGTRMTLQLTWEGCDSALAAPLVLDLARLVSAAHAAGRTGPLTELAFFFKDPVGGTEHRLAQQWDDLVSWRRGLDA
jgi:myo-inositol-1-phosphate synthase